MDILAVALAGSFVVFYDENANGRLDPDERVRFAEARVEVAAGTASVAPDSLPPFYVPGRPAAVPASGVVALPVTLSIGSNHPNTYLAFGDSLTEGDGSSDATGYCRRLESRLRAALGAATVVADGVSGTDSHRGARRIAKALARYHPAATLVLYGTNDWDETGREVMTVNSLRRIVRQVKEARSSPFLATLVPTNVGSDARASAERNRWVGRINESIRTLARDEGAVLVDLEAAFDRAGDPRRLYSDGLHPNDAGYDLVAATFFEAIVRRRP